MLPVLRLAGKGEWRVPEAAEKIADEFSLSPEERDELLPSGKQRIFHNRIHWAKFYMSKAGLIESPKRGLFTASAAGKALLSQNPPSIDNETLNQFPAFVEFRLGNSKESGTAVKQAAVAASASEATPEEQIDAAQAILRSALSSDVLQRILDNSPSFFENVIVELLVAMGVWGNA